MKRRTFLAGGAVAGAAAAIVRPSAPWAADQRLAPDDIETAVARLRAQYLQFDPAYVENVIVPHFLVSIYKGERMFLPMVDLQFTKENAIPRDLWGLLSESWKIAPEDGVTVFLQGLENRGPENMRKRIYMSALTPDLYQPMYSGKVVRFFDKLLDGRNANRPLMRPYLESYFDLYWDLHLGVKGEMIPARVLQIGESFNTVLAHRDPTQEIVYVHYMMVREHLAFLKEWIDEKIDDLKTGITPDPEKTFVHYWIKNGGEGENFAHKDVVFEVFHNFVALSQWGNTIYNIMLKLASDTGDADARAWFRKTMEGDFDKADGSAFTPLERFVMELFRTISPNGGTISAMAEGREPPFPRHGYVVTPHAESSFAPMHWSDPDSFNPDRYKAAPTSHDIDEARCRQVGFTACPFERTAFEVKDGRRASIRNSAFGTVYGVVDEKPLPVCDSAGFAPFGFGYRRCPGEQLTIQVFEDFLKKVWASKIEFQKLDIADAEQLPIGPSTVIADDVGFTRFA